MQRKRLQEKRGLFTKKFWTNPEKRDGHAFSQEPSNRKIQKRVRGTMRVYTEEEWQQFVNNVKQRADSMSPESRWIMT